jgi:hypothetical protein
MCRQSPQAVAWGTVPFRPEGLTLLIRDGLLTVNRVHFRRFVSFGKPA